MTDTVLRPKHYIQGSHECIDEIKAMLTPCEFQGFIKGNIIKYRYRANLKNGKEDLEKADNYAYYLINGHFKDKDVNKNDDDISNNSDDDSAHDVFKHLVDDPCDLVSNPEKLLKFLEQVKFIDTYKGKKIEHGKDTLSFNLFSNLKRVMPIAHLIVTMYNQKDISNVTPVTLRCISSYMTTGTRVDFNHTPNKPDTAKVVFRDKSVLHVKVPSGCTVSDIFKPDVVTKWRDVYEINSEE